MKKIITALTYPQISMAIVVYVGVSEWFHTIWNTYAFLFAITVPWCMYLPMIPPQRSIPWILLVVVLYAYGQELPVWYAFWLTTFEFCGYFFIKKVPQGSAIVRYVHSIVSVLLLVLFIWAHSIFLGPSPVVPHPQTTENKLILQV